MNKFNSRVCMSYSYNLLISLMRLIIVKLIKHYLSFPCSTFKLFLNLLYRNILT